MAESCLAEGGEGAGVADRAELFARHERWLRTVVASQLREPLAVEEVMQDVALAAVAQPSVPTESVRWGPWLYRIAVRSALLYKRRLGRERRRLDVYARRAAWEEGAAAYDPLRLIIHDEVRSLVRTAVARLPRKQAEMLLLKYAEGWSYDEIAVHLGRTRSSVESGLHRARKRLRAELTALETREART